MNFTFKLDGTRTPEEYRKIWTYLHEQKEQEYEKEKQKIEKEKPE